MRGWRWGPVSKQTVSIQKGSVMQRTCTSAMGAWERGAKTLFSGSSVITDSVEEQSADEGDGGEVV